MLTSVSVGQSESESASSESGTLVLCEERKEKHIKYNNAFTEKLPDWLTDSYYAWHPYVHCKIVIANKYEFVANAIVIMLCLNNSIYDKTI